jgi:hypothetical protein
MFEKRNKMKTGTKQLAGKNQNRLNSKKKESRPGPGEILNLSRRLSK